MTMNPKISLTFLTVLLAAVSPAFTQTTIIQPGQQMLERANPMDLVPMEGQTGNTHADPTPTPAHESIANENDPNSDLGKKPGETVYDKSAPPKEKANAFETEHRGRINFGKRAEHMVVKQSSKTAKIQKTKDGSSDASVGTGLFEGSLLDSSLPRPQTKSAVDALTNGGAVPSSEPEPSASPGSKADSHLNEDRFALSLGVGPEANPSPSPQASLDTSGEQ